MGTRLLKTTDNCWLNTTKLFNGKRVLNEGSFSAFQISFIFKACSLTVHGLIFFVYFSGLFHPFLK